MRLFRGEGGLNNNNNKGEEKEILELIGKKRMKKVERKGPSPREGENMVRRRAESSLKKQK